MNREINSANLWAKVDRESFLRRPFIHHLLASSDWEKKRWKKVDSRFFVGMENLLALESRTPSRWWNGKNRKKSHLNFSSDPRMDFWAWKKKEEKRAETKVAINLYSNERSSITGLGERERRLLSKKYILKQTQCRSLLLFFLCVVIGSVQFAFFAALSTPSIRPRRQNWCINHTKNNIYAPIYIFCIKKRMSPSPNMKTVLSCRKISNKTVKYNPYQIHENIWLAQPSG